MGKIKSLNDSLRETRRELKKKEVEAIKHATHAKKLAELNEELRNLFEEERKMTTN